VSVLDVFIRLWDLSCQNLSSFCNYNDLCTSKVVFVLEQVDLLVFDISGDLEVVPISVCNKKMLGSLPPMFVYLKSNVVHNAAELQPISAFYSKGKRTQCLYTQRDVCNIGS
jgi:hypothetical protein